jgi:hypothetical protein
VAEGYALSQPYGDGLGTQFYERGVTPAAGASFVSAFDPRLGVRRLVACTFTLTTDANAANRYVTVEYTDGAGVSYAADAAAVIVTASTSNQRFCGSVSRGVAEWNANTDVLFPLTPVFVKDGFQVKINVANVQVGDQLSLIGFVTDRFAGGNEPEPFESE